MVDAVKHTVAHVSPRIQDKLADKKKTQENNYVHKLIN